MNKLSLIEKYYRTDLPSIEVGDKIEVSVKNETVSKSPNRKVEKKSKSSGSRVTIFKGIVIAQKNQKQLSYTFKVLKESHKISVTSVFQYHSPLIVQIKKLGKINEKVRRAKLYYLEKSIARKKDNE